MIEQTLAIEAAGTAFQVTARTDAEIRLWAESGPLDEEGGQVVRLIAEAVTGRGFTLEELRFEWTVPVVDMHALYFGGNPRTELTYLPFWDIEKTVSANQGFPFLALLQRGGENRFAFGLADQLSETQLQGHLSELTRCYHFTVRKPGHGGVKVTGRYQEVLFVSRQRQPWPEVLGRYRAVVEATNAEPALPVSAGDFAPVFCSWTAIHHDVSHEWVMRQAPLAAELGFGTWLTDDGWFIESGRFADYSRAGDWEPCTSKFPDMREHVAAVQRLGLRYVLWVSPFMVGTESKAARAYRHLLIPGGERQRFDNLSPWEPETKEIVTELLVRLVRDYGLDGLKIDFIDSVRSQNGRPPGADGAGLGERLYRILAEAVDALRAIQPEVMIEFRNPYANLASRRYANLYRSSDVPLNFTLNRWQAVMLRLLTPDRAVHLDPALWHPDDTDENVAVHLINCLVGVPMVSIELDRYPRSHVELIRHWIGFYNRHRQTFVGGGFRPVLGLGHVPAVRFAGDGEEIVALYDDVPVTLQPTPWTAILNASTRPYVDVSGDGPKGDYRMVERDKLGRTVSERVVPLPQARLAVEIGGSLELVPA